MTVRLVSLNLNHRTNAKVLPPDLVPALLALGPDILVLCEYVEGHGRPDFHEALRAGGLAHIEVSDTNKYAGGRWHNQVLIASRWSIRTCPSPAPGPDPCCVPNYLSIRTAGLLLTGVRVPAFKVAADWYAHWEWLTSVLDGDIAIGDFNADPVRHRRRDRVLSSLADTLGFTIITPGASWSFRHRGGTTCCIDHALVRNGVRVASARYETIPFVSQLTDHAALVVEFE